MNDFYKSNQLLNENKFKESQMKNIFELLELVNSIPSKLYQGSQDIIISSISSQVFLNANTTPPPKCHKNWQDSGHSGHFGILEFSFGYKIGYNYPYIGQRSIETLETRLKTLFQPQRRQEN